MDVKNTLRHRDLLIYQTGLLGKTFLESVYLGTDDCLVCFLIFSQNLFQQKANVKNYVFLRGQGKEIYFMCFPCLPLQSPLSILTTFSS